MNTHIPVLIDAIIEVFLKNLEVSENKIQVFDGTFGGGGYSKLFLEKDYQVKACDLDYLAFINKPENPNLELVKANFADHITNFEDNYFDLIVVDLGFSNNQLNQSKKGFSYQNLEEFLDLRYDQETRKSASELLLNTSAESLSKIIYQHSGEQFARKIANSIVENRKGLKIITVNDLVIWINSVIPAKYYNKRNQILSRVWQALRIFVNQEFYNLEKFLEIAPKKLKNNGLLCVVNFHSLEDKITTKKFRNLAKTFDRDKYGNKGQYYKLLTKKPIIPKQEEIERNKQSRSATLRILQKCHEKNS